MLRTILGGRERRDRFYQEGVPPLSSMPWASSGSTVTQANAMRVAAIHSVVSLLTDTVSTLPVGTFDRIDSARVPVPMPRFLLSPVPDDPSVTTIDHFSQVTWGLALDGNSFTLALPDVYEPEQLLVVNPLRVAIRKRARYEIELDGGRETLGPDQIVHIARTRSPGGLRGPSPVDEAGASFAMRKAAEDFANRVFGNRVFLSGALTVPGALSPDSHELLKKEIEKQYGGDNVGKPGVFTNGAKWEIPRVNFEELQLAEIHKSAKLEAAGLWRVPPYLLGVTDPGAMAFASVEAQGMHFERYTIRAYIERIEAAYDRLIPGNATFLKFNTSGLLRADFKSRMEGYQIALNARLLRANDVHVLEDWAPLPEEHGGFLDTPNNRTPDPRIVDLGALVRAGFEPEAAAAFLGMPPIKHTGLIPVTVQTENPPSTGRTPA